MTCTPRPSTRAIIDDRMSVISAFGKSWLISNIPLHSSIIYHRHALKTGQAVNRDLHFAVASVCVCVIPLRYLRSKLNCSEPRGFFLWVVFVCLYFSLFSICLPDSLFVTDFNGQKMSDLIARCRVIDINLYDRTASQRLRPYICLSLSNFNAKGDRSV